MARPSADRGPGGLVRDTHQLRTVAAERLSPPSHRAPRPGAGVVMGWTAKARPAAATPLEHDSLWPPDSRD